MQPESTPPNLGRVAFRYGIIIGLILAVVEVIILVLNTFIFAANTSSVNAGTASSLGSSAFVIIFAIIGFVLGLTAYFVAGILAARQTGKVRTGVFAGMWTGGVYSLIGCITYITLFFTVTLGPTVVQYASTHATTPVSSFRAILIGGALVGSFIGIAVAIGWGAGLGALGGLIGRNSWRAKHPVYPGQPYPPMQQYPPAQGYPAQSYPGQGYPAQSYPGQGYPAQGYPTPWPNPYQSPMQPGNGTPERPLPQSEGVGSAGNVERTQIDRSYNPPEQANQAWSGSVPHPRPDPLQEPENPYAN